MKLHIQEIRKSPEGLAFERQFDLAEELKQRNQEILDVTEIVAKGRVQQEDGLYFLDYDLSYKISLASSRSMRPVEMAEAYLVNEVFIDSSQASKDKQTLLDEDLVLPIEGDEIDLAESVADNILLHIPLKILTADEEENADLPSGNDWQVLTEEDYQKQQATHKEANSPFAGLQGLFEVED